MLRFFILIVICSMLWSCASPEPEGPYQETIDGQPVYHKDNPELQQGPTFKQSKFRVYTVYKPQIQRVNFNGVFHLTPDGGRIVTEFWQSKFNEKTRAGFYDLFFTEFYDYMSYLAQSYPMEIPQKRRTMDSLEKSFMFFCTSLKIIDEFREFKLRQMAIYSLDREE